jgi:MATE family multidrug resistance protein
MIAIYVFLPDILLSPFATKANAECFAPIRELSLVLIRFVAVYAAFDMVNIIFASAIKGAGDTRFVMYIIITASLLLLIIPSYIALFVFNGDIYTGWLIVTIYIIILSLVFYMRFRGGKWKSMSVIEESHAIVATSIPEIPVIN